MQLRGSEHETALKTLELFAYGTWKDYKGSCEIVCDPAGVLKSINMTFGDKSLDIKLASCNDAKCECLQLVLLLSFL